MTDDVVPVGDAVVEAAPDAASELDESAEASVVVESGGGVVESGGAVVESGGVVVATDEDDDDVVVVVDDEEEAGGTATLIELDVVVLLSAVALDEAAVDAPGIKTSLHRRSSFTTSFPLASVSGVKMI